MPKIIRIETFGDQLALCLDDGTKKLGVNVNQRWMFPNFAPVTMVEIFGNYLGVTVNGVIKLAYEATSGYWLLDPIQMGAVEPEPSGWAWPYQYSVGVIQNDAFAQFGPRSPTRMHNGLDFGAGAVQGKQNRAASAGVVSFAGDQGTFGDVVHIDHPGGFHTIYAHHVEGSLLVSTGQTVTMLQELGKMGQSGGNSTGVHLHWETHVNGVPINPRDFMAQRGVPES